MRSKNPDINYRVFVISLKNAFSVLIRVRTAKIKNFLRSFVIWKTVDVFLQYASCKKAPFFSMESVAIKKGNEKRKNTIFEINMNRFFIMDRLTNDKVDLK